MPGPKSLSDDTKDLGKGAIAFKVGYNDMFHLQSVQGLIDKL
jgi:hypothetical protein